nr:protein FAM204A-like [Lytechinus pictus]
MMLAILGGFLDEEISSESSDDSDQSANEQDHKFKNKSAADKSDIPSGELTPSHQFSAPGAPAEDAPSKPLIPDDSANSVAGDKTDFLSKYDQIQKFQNLQAQRIQATKEKIPEGHRRRRRRKRRNQFQDNQADDCDSPSKKQPCQHSEELSSTSDGPSEAGPSKNEQEHWDTLKEYLDVNSHISQGVDHGHLAPDKSGLEKRLEEAIAEGEFERAEKLSEKLSVRDLGCRIANAANARDYMKWKLEREEEKAAKKRKKKKKLAWGFEVKNRWEMKANM